VRSLFLFALLFRGTVEAGDFSKGFGRTDTVRLVTPRLPVFFTGAVRVAVVIEEAPAGLPAHQLSAAIEQRLSTDFSITPSNPELTFRVRAFLETPKAEIASRNESVKVQTGTRPAVDANGNPVLNAAGQQVTQPVYETREMPVEVWQGSGRLSLQVEVFGVGGAALDGFAPSQSFSKRIIVSADGNPQVDRNQLPNEPQILDAMIAGVAEPFLERYCRGKESIEVRLAVDDELRPANELAKAGQWPRAAEMWSAVEPKKFPGDRLHNLGVAYESTFYELYWRGENPEKLEAAWLQAKKFHDDAIGRDPKEKAHSFAQERLRSGRQLMDRLRAALERGKRSAQNPAGGNSIFTGGAGQGAGAGVNASNQEFRRLVRMRIRNLAVSPENERPSLETTGVQAFQLSPEEAKKQMEEEIAPWIQVREKLLTYKTTFDALNLDQKISREERSVLRGLAARLALSPDDLKLVEVPGTFTEGQ
jgi:hypothetical protein